MEGETTIFEEFNPTKEVLDAGLSEAKAALTNLGLKEFADKLPGLSDVKLFIGYAPSDDIEANGAFAAFVEEEEGKRTGISVVAELPAHRFPSDYIPAIKEQLFRGVVDFLAPEPEIHDLELKMRADKELKKGANEFATFVSTNAVQMQKNDFGGFLRALFTEKTPEVMPDLA